MQKCFSTSGLHVADGKENLTDTLLALSIPNIPEINISGR